MPIRQFTQNMNIISALSDEPNVDDGLTSAQLKAKFDEGGLAVKSYLNSTLIPDIGDVINESINQAVISKGNLPLGGSVNHVLVKNSALDFDAKFAAFSDVFGASDVALNTQVSSRLGYASANVNDGINALADRVAWYVTCATAAATAAKSVTVNGFTLAAGARVIVFFAFANTAAAPTLNVNGTGAKPIRYRNAEVEPSHISATAPHLFVFDGASWQLANPVPPAVVSGTIVWPAEIQPITVNIGFRPRFIALNNTMGLNFCAAIPQGVSSITALVYRLYSTSVFVNTVTFQISSSGFVVVPGSNFIHVNTGQVSPGDTTAYFAI